jgi:hypothetical protein
VDRANQRFAPSCELIRSDFGTTTHRRVHGHSWLVVQYWTAAFLAMTYG